MKRIVGLILLILVLAYLATGVYQVRPNEQAVVRRFGRVLEEPRLPGLNIGLPWGMDRVDRVAVDQQRTITVGFQEGEPVPAGTAPPGQVLLGDDNLLDLRITLQYRVDPEHVVDYVLNLDRLEGVLRRASEMAMSSVMAGQKANDVLFGQAKDLGPLLRVHMNRVLAEYRLGIAIDGVTVGVRAPVELADDFQKISRAEAQARQAVSAAQALRDTEVKTAENEATNKTKPAADADYQQRVLAARAEAKAFLALWQQYRGTSDPHQNALLTLYLNEMQAIFAKLQVRTLSPKNAEQTIIITPPER